MNKTIITGMFVAATLATAYAQEQDSSTAGRPPMPPKKMEMRGMASSSMPMPKPMMTTGDTELDKQVQALHKEMEDKIKAIRDDYEARIKTLLGDKKMMNATGTMMMEKREERKEMREERREQMQNASGTLPQVKDLFKPLKVRAEGEGQLDLDFGTRLREFFRGFLGGN
jgi:hypothetical protein